ncbi:MAG: hypothetical protein ACW98Y_09410 [Candidatus Thorarchaeota archaeon]|jgi:hypothetical protein
MAKEIPTNPFAPMKMWSNTVVTVKDGDSKKNVDAKNYHIRYVVGEGTAKRFVDHGSGMHEVSDKTIYFTPSVHKMMEEPFHYDGSKVESIVGERQTENTKNLARKDFCDDHEIVEVSFMSPGVECCAMTKEEADKHGVPLQFQAGYLLGRSDGMLKLALTKTELDSGSSYYENIHVIPEAVVQSIQCLE